MRHYTPNCLIPFNVPLKLWERFCSKVSVCPETGCWMWTGPYFPFGYGNFRYQKSINNRIAITAHRFAFQSLIGNIPDGLVLDHLCRVRGCVNPVHLEIVTQRINILRGEGACAKHAKKSHCKWGHEFTPQNTRYDRGGGRHCKSCEKRTACYRQRKYAAKRKGKDFTEIFAEVTK